VARANSGAVEVAAAGGPVGVHLDEERIAAAVAEQGGWMEELLIRLVEAPTVLGNEEAGQRVMEDAFRSLGLEPVDVPLDAGTLRSHPNASSFSWDVAGKRNVVATWPAAGNGGRSLILGGHVDVVPPGAEGLWTHPPFEAVREGDWIYGRGSGDMKAGLAAIAGAVRGLRSLGLEPRAPIQLQSVVEEECTGNGALQCVASGPRADACVIAEPHFDHITTAQVGVLWFRVEIEGVAAHAGHAELGENAIEAAFAVIAALRELELELNRDPPPPFDRVEHPLHLNVGVIRGGDWPSTVAPECAASCRLACYPGEEPGRLRERVEARIADVAARHPFLAARPPRVTYEGFSCEGFALPDDEPVAVALADACEAVLGRRPPLVPTTATTDARHFVRAGIPAVCFGPRAERVHGIDERVAVSSVIESAQGLGVFVARWCGVT
jgi:acetylornithine deacetylase